MSKAKYMFQKEWMRNSDLFPHHYTTMAGAAALYFDSNQKTIISEKFDKSGAQ